MIEWLQKIVIGHTHRWELIDDVVLTGGFGTKGRRHYLQCKVCGKTKKRDFL